jgi:hypothetical protein
MSALYQVKALTVKPAFFSGAAFAILDIAGYTIDGFCRYFDAK